MGSEELSGFWMDCLLENEENGEWMNWEQKRMDEWKAEGKENE